MHSKFPWVHTDVNWIYKWQKIDKSFVQKIFKSCSSLQGGGVWTLFSAGCFSWLLKRKEWKGGKHFAWKTWHVRPQPSDPGQHHEWWVVLTAHTLDSLWWKGTLPLVFLPKSFMQSKHDKDIWKTPFEWEPTMYPGLCKALDTHQGTKTANIPVFCGVQTQTEVSVFPA